MKLCYIITCLPNQVTSFEIFLQTCDNTMIDTSREYHEEVEKDWISVVSGAKTETFDRYTPWELTQKWAKVQVTFDDECIFHKT